MRLPGWLVGLGVVAWIAATVVCSGGAFVAARQTQLQSAEIGLELPELVVGNSRPTAVAQLPSPTPMPDAVATTSVAADDEAAPAPTEDAAATFAAAMAEAASNFPTQDSADSQTNAVGDSIELSGDENVLVRRALESIGPRKMTVLLLGIDQRSAGSMSEERFFRTDTMILAQIDPARRTAAMLSVPRDLYIPIPGHEEARINTANVLGDAGGYPGGGPALAMKSVESVVGIPIDYYVLVNFSVFTTVVDTLAPDGVEVCVPQEIYDPTYPDEGDGFIEVRFDAGCQQLDSERLLQYARTRKTEGSDFDRSRRQQQVILATQEEIVSAGGLANLVRRAPALWSQLGENLRTDMELQTAVDLALVTTTIERDNIQVGQINNLHTRFAKDDTGQDVLIPVPASISVLVQDTFNAQANMTTDDLRARAEEEQASIILLNNTTTVGLAGQTQTWLAEQGVQVTTVGNTENPDNSAGTIIRDYTGNPWTARYLAAVMDVPRENILPGDGQTSEDIAVVLGADVQQLIGP